MFVEFKLVIFCFCSDWRAQVDHEDSAVMDLIRSDDWVQSQHMIVNFICVAVLLYFPTIYP